MSDPVVVCVMLTRDRPEMTARAVASFRAQTYERKMLVIWDTSAGRPFSLSMHLPDNEWCVEDVADFSIGELRNRAIMWAGKWSPDIIATFDSDEWSHPNRLAEQVSLLESSGADCVGYSELLFWDERKYVGKRDRTATIQYVGADVYPYANIGDDVEGHVNQAYLYTRGSRYTCPGTSLMYWRRVWEQKPFPPKPNAQDPGGEDTEWQSGLKVVGVSSIEHWRSLPEIAPGAVQHEDCEPRMIASIHGGNTSNIATALTMAKEYRRVPAWDAYCKKAMELEVAK